MGLHYPRICDGLFPSYKGHSHPLILPQLCLTTISSQSHHNAGRSSCLLKNSLRNILAESSCLLNIGRQSVRSHKSEGSEILRDNMKTLKELLFNL